MGMSLLEARYQPPSPSGKVAAAEGKRCHQWSVSPTGSPETATTREVKP